MVRRIMIAIENVIVVIVGILIATYCYFCFSFAST